jgi:predicted nucleic acid-binding protein
MFPPMPNTAQSDLSWKRSESQWAGTLIAAHAHATGATIVSANVDAFERIRGLKVENWLA